MGGAASARGFKATADESPSYASSKRKGKRSCSIPQANRSKLVDENGEKLVVWHGKLSKINKRTAASPTLNSRGVEGPEPAAPRGSARKVTQMRDVAQGKGEKQRGLPPILPLPLMVLRGSRVAVSLPVILSAKVGKRETPRKRKAEKAWAKGKKKPLISRNLPLPRGHHLKPKKSFLPQK